MLPSLVERTVNMSRAISPVALTRRWVCGSTARASLVLASRRWKPFFGSWERVHVGDEKVEEWERVLVRVPRGFVPVPMAVVVALQNALLVMVVITMVSKGQKHVGLGRVVNLVTARNLQLFPWRYPMTYLSCSL